MSGATFKCKSFNNIYVSSTPGCNNKISSPNVLLDIASSVQYNKELCVESGRRTSRPVSKRAFHRWSMSWVRPIGRQEEYRQKIRVAVHYDIQADIYHIQVFDVNASRHHYFLFPPATTACLSLRLSSQPTRGQQNSQDTSNDGRCPMRLSLNNEAQYLALCFIVIKFDATMKYEKTAREGFLTGAQRAQKFCASRGRVEIVQRQYAPFTQSLSNQTA
jgi:hypothetical protein